MASSSTPSTRSPTQAQAGDKPVNFFQKMKAANGIQRDDGITNRAVVGRALVAALTCEPADLTMNVEEACGPSWSRTGRRGSRTRRTVGSLIRSQTGTRPPPRPRSRPATAGC